MPARAPKPPMEHSLNDPKCTEPLLQIENRAKLPMFHYGQNPGSDLE